MLESELRFLVFLCIFGWQIDLEWSHVHRRCPCGVYSGVLGGRGSKVEVCVESLKQVNIEIRAMIFSISMYFWTDNSI